MKILAKLFVVLLCVSCSNGLSKKDALSVLKEEYSESCSDYVMRNDDIIPRGRNAEVFLGAWKKLEEQGLIRVERVKNVGFMHFTEKARTEYNAEKARADLLTCEIVRVKGISQTDKLATVSFEIRLMPTVFYDVRISGCDEENSNTFERTVEMIHYDTGWRIK